MSSSLSSAHGRRDEAAGFSGTRQRWSMDGESRLRLDHPRLVCLRIGEEEGIFPTVTCPHTGISTSPRLESDSMDSAADSSACWTQQRGRYTCVCVDLRGRGNRPGVVVGC
jgi:hypothetical protein